MKTLENPFSDTHDQDHDDHHQHSLLSPLCGVFTIINLKQTVFLGYIVMQLFTICATCNVISDVTYVLHFYISAFLITYVCNVQYGCLTFFLYFFDFMLSCLLLRYEVLPKNTVNV